MQIVEVRNAFIVVTCKPSDALQGLDDRSKQREISERLVQLDKASTQLGHITPQPASSRCECAKHFHINGASRRALHMKLTTSSLAQSLRVCSHYTVQPAHALSAVPSERRILADSSTVTPRT